MSVHYKFKSTLEYDTVKFDGLHISVKDLKHAIIQQKRIGRNTDYDLQVTNAQTKEIYENEQALIPKNTSLLIARIPLAVPNKSKTWEGYGHDTVQVTRHDDGGPIAKAMDLASLDASENDKIMAMMSQSTQDYDPSNYVKIRGANQVGQVPHNYRCYKCHQPGHWIKDCPLSQCGDSIDIKKSTGIPRSFMVEVEGPEVQGAMMTPYGSFAVPALDHQIYTQKNQPAPAPPPIQKPDIPEDLLCSICSDLLTDAVMIPCCGNSFCDECIRSCLLDSEDHECPDCHDRDISPGTLIPNRFLRNSVINFKSTTGYIKRQIYRPALLAMNAANANKKNSTKSKPEESVETKPASIVGDTKPPAKKETNITPNIDAPGPSERLIISEADSTEPTKNNDTKDIKDELTDPPTDEHPPGVSPARETKPAAAVPTVNEPDPPPTNRNPVTEERSGTPTVDEPGAPSAVPPPIRNGGVPGHPNPPPIEVPQHPIPAMHSGSIPYDNLPPMHYTAPPQSLYPPVNYRMPPPGHHVYNMYNMPPRPGMFDQSHPGQQMMMPQQNFFNNGPPNFPPPVDIRPGIIDDPLEAFNRMLREKDERERRAKANRRGRSYSRSSSRSFSRSPYARRRPSFSPRRRSRSRTHSFSMSRSRSRSYSPNRGNSYREYSPSRRGQGRYRPSQHPSPTRYRYRDGPPREREWDRGRERERFEPREVDRIYERPNRRERSNEWDRGRNFGPRGNDALVHESSMREMPPHCHTSGPQHVSTQHVHVHVLGSQNASGMNPGPERIPDRYHANENYDRHHDRGGQWNQGPSNDFYYRNEGPPHQPHSFEMQSPHYDQRPPSGSHRFSPYYGGSINQGNPPVGNAIPETGITHSQSDEPTKQQSFNDVLPPGTDQPLPPGEDPFPRYADMSGSGDARDQNEHHGFRDDWADDKDREWRDGHMQHERDRQRYSRDRGPYRDRSRDRDKGKDRELAKEKEKHRERRNSRSTSRQPSKTQRRKSRNNSPKRDEKKKDKEREKDKDKCSHSEDDKCKKCKDKKKKREKKDSDKKKKKDKREKKEHKKDEKAKDNKESEVRTDKNSHSEKVPEEPTVEALISSAIQDAPSDDIDNVPNIETSVPEQSVSVEKGTLCEIYQEQPNVLVETETTSAPLPDLIIPPEDILVRASVSPVDINPCKEPSPAPQANLNKPDDDVLELYTGELKSELGLAPMPEPSRWEVEDEQSQASAGECEGKIDKSKVTQDVLKRAENAIFAKAINAIRPIEIKKISVDRAKLYSGEKEREEGELPDEDNPDEQDNEQEQGLDTNPMLAPARLSVKERLGHKVDDSDRIVRVDQKARSRTRSPTAKRLGSKDRRVIEMDSRSGRRTQYDRNRDNRDRDRRDRPYREKDRDRDRRDERSTRGETRRSSRDRDSERRREDKPSIGNKERFRHRLGDREEPRGWSSSGTSNSKLDKRKRSRSRSQSRDKRDDRRKKDKQQKRDKEDHREQEKNREKNIDKERVHRRPTDEHVERDKPSAPSAKSREDAPPAPDQPKILAAIATPPPAQISEKDFVPDYDGESDHERQSLAKPISQPDTETAKKKRSESSSSSSDSSSDEDRKRKKHKKRSKKKKRRESTSSSTSDSSSSDDEKEKSKRRKHKKKSKKKKKSKHKS